MQAEGQDGLKVPPLWAELHRLAAARLGGSVEARWFVEEASGVPWVEAMAAQAPARGQRAFWSMVDRRLAGEPVQYVLGHWSFRSLDLMVDRRVLIPRPETEVVVDMALKELDGLGTSRPVVDLGTGSGAIALSIAVERQRARVFATDVSPGALAVASANLAGLGARAAGRVQLKLGDWWGALPEALEGNIALAVCNPPYVSLPELPSLPAEVACWEPREALVAGESGLEALEAVLEGTPRWLAKGAALVAEIAPHQAERAGELAAAAGLAEVAVRRDLAGRDRVLVARRR